MNINTCVAMPIYELKRVKIAAPTVTSIYSYRTSKTDQAQKLREKEKNQIYSNNKNYGDRYDFPVNYPTVKEIQSSANTFGTNLGTIPF